MDNFDILKQNLDIAIDPNAGIGQILAQKHNDYVTEFMSKQGKYVGSPFTAKATYQGVANPGELFLNGALNDVNGLGIITSKLTNDLNDFGIVLQTLSSGDLIHFKDYVGRSCYFVFKSFFATNDNNNNEIYQIDVTPNANNINYTYQANESKICVLETLKAKSTGGGSIFEQVELKLFWGAKGDGKTPFKKIFDMKRLIFIDPNNGTPFHKTIPTDVFFLGVNCPQWELIKNLKPRLVIERFKRRRSNGTSIEVFSESSYKQQFPYSDDVQINDVNGQYSVSRPMFISMNGKKEYYDIEAQHYFNIFKTPHAYGNSHFLTKSNGDIALYDDTHKDFAKIPKKQKGYSHCLLRLELTTKDGVIVSKPMLYFKIVNQLTFSDKRTGIDFEPEIARIKYQYQ